MSKSYVRIAVAVAVALAVVALPAFAKEKGEKGAGKGKSQTIEGTVESVDAAAKTVVVKVGDESKTINTDDSTKIKVGKNKTATLGDLQVGSTVTVSLKKDVAKSIVAKGGKKKK